MYLKGVAETLGIKFQRAGKSLLMTWADFLRLEEHIQKVDQLTAVTA